MGYAYHKHSYNRPSSSSIVHRSHHAYTIVSLGQELTDRKAISPRACSILFSRASIDIHSQVRSLVPSLICLVRAYSALPKTLRSLRKGYSVDIAQMTARKGWYRKIGLLTPGMDEVHIPHSIFYLLTYWSQGMSEACVSLKISSISTFLDTLWCEDTEPCSQETATSW